MMKPKFVCRNFAKHPKNERKLNNFIDSLRTAASNGRCKCSPSVAKWKNLKHRCKSDLPLPLPLSVSVIHFLRLKNESGLGFHNPTTEFSKAQIDISLNSHLGITQMSRREKWTSGRTYELHTGCILFGDKLKWALWKLISLLLGHILFDCWV